MFESHVLRTEQGSSWVRFVGPETEVCMMAVGLCAHSGSHGLAELASWDRPGLGQRF